MSIRGDNVFIGNNVKIENDVILEDNVYIDHNSIIRSGVHIGKGSYIGCNCIVGEYYGSYLMNTEEFKSCRLEIGEGAIIRSGTIIYTDSKIGVAFQTGHRVTVREKCTLGEHVRVGTLSDVQHSCVIGDYVSLHSNVFLGEETVIKDFVWIFPGVTITNDPTPPSNNLKPVTVEQYAVISARAVLLPGIVVGKNSLIGAGSVVTKDVPDEKVVIGSPGRIVGDIRDVRNKETGETAYPWPEHFKRGMPWDE